MSTAIGATTVRGDAAAKVAGSARFGVDVVLPRMLHARLLRSPLPAGRIRRLDTAAASGLPGVHAVVTAADAPAHRSGLALHDAPLFAAEYARYEGEPIAAVVAETREQADAAVAAIDLDIEAIPAAIDAATALGPGAPLVHPEWESFGTVGGLEWPRYDNVVSEVVSDPDGVDAAFAAADEVVEGRYEAGRQYQAYMEPRMAVAEYDSGRWTIHVAHQFPFNVRDRVAVALGVRPSDIRVVGHHIGGGFGAKLDTGLEPYAALLARKVGRPVKLVNERSEDLLTCQCRENAIVTIKTAVARDGTMLARDVDVVMDVGAHATDAPFLTSIPMFVFGSLYRVGPTRVRTRAVYTNTAPTGAFRGVNGTHLYFALERHTDEIANQLGIDRREFRLRNICQDGDQMLNGQVLHDAGIFQEAFAAVEAAAPWTETGQGPYRGVGIAGCVWLTNPLSGTATLKLNEDGTLGVLTAATENGSGAVELGVRQIAAAELGLSPEDVVLTMPDTDAAAFDAGSQGSRTTHIVGRAVRDAGAAVRERVFEIASRLLEADQGDLELAEGSVGVKGVPASRIPLADVAAAARAESGTITGTGSYATEMPQSNPSCASGMLFPAWPTPTYHVHLAEVEVDPVAGRVHVLRYVVAQEVGAAINPAGVVGQIQGGVVQGLGYALWEKLEIADGRYEQRTFETYGLPLAVDVPEVEVILLEHPDTEGPHGAKGVAEPPVVPVAAAIANAVADATGAPVDHIPITMEAVLDGLEA